MPDLNNLNKNYSSYIIENQYFPVVGWIKISKEFSYCKIEQYENFQKMTYRNRCLVSGSNGIVNLTIPLQKGREQKSLIREIKIDNSQNWQKQHWRTILSSYSRAPFFEYYADGIRELIYRPHQFLFDLDLEIVEWLKKVLKLSVQFELTSSYKKEYREAGELDLRNRWLPKNRGDENNGGSEQERYTQVFEDKFGFIPNLSILDLLFCKGSI
jgi:hypothetical protein